MNVRLLDRGGDEMVVATVGGRDAVMAVWRIESKPEPGRRLVYSDPI